MSKPKNKSKLASMLRKLMAAEKITSEAELAKQADLPQPTVHRILSGKTEHPRKAALEALSNLFSISISQLIGEEPLSISSAPTQPSTLKISSKVPLIKWEDVNTWPEQAAIYKEDLHTSWIPTFTKLSEGAFALKVTDTSMEPRFPEGTIILVDPDIKPKDRNFAIICLEDGKSVFKQLVIDGYNTYLKSLNPDLSQMIALLKEKDVIKGIVAQALINYVE